MRHDSTGAAARRLARSGPCRCLEPILSGTGSDRVGWLLAALAAPFLVAAGSGRVEAVTIALVGRSAGISFGAGGTPILPQIAVTPFTGLELAAATGIYHSLVGWVMPLVAMLLVTRSLPPEQRAGRAIWPRGSSRA